MPDVQMNSSLPLRRRIRRPGRQPRRGGVLVWFVYIIPLMMLLLFALTDYGTTARTGIELKNAVDAAALSAVKSWHSLGQSAAWRDAGATFQGNAVLGAARALKSTTSDQQSPDFLGRSTEVTFGMLEDRGGVHVFHPISANMMQSDHLQLPGSSLVSQKTDHRSSSLCVRVRRSVMMTGVGGQLQKETFGDYSITAESFARLCPDRLTPQLVHVDHISSVVGSWETIP